MHFSSRGLHVHNNSSSTVVVDDPATQPVQQISSPVTWVRYNVPTHMYDFKANINMKKPTHLRKRRRTMPHPRLHRTIHDTSRASHSTCMKSALLPPSHAPHTASPAPPRVPATATIATIGYYSMMLCLVVFNWGKNVWPFS